jgi:hypothetical protein
LEFEAGQDMTEVGGKGIPLGALGKHSGRKEPEACKGGIEVTVPEFVPEFPELKRPRRRQAAHYVAPLTVKGESTEYGKNKGRRIC